MRELTEKTGHRATPVIVIDSEVIVGFEVSDTEADMFRSYVQRRDRDEPLQYIEGTVPFGAVSINVDSRVLVPRPETEYLFE